MGGPGAMLRWVEAGLARPDHVHLSAEGYQLLAERLLRALDASGPGRPARP
jgi:lysophospholipase L1-like esterase